MMMSMSVTVLISVLVTVRGGSGLSCECDGFGSGEDDGFGACEIENEREWMDTGRTLDRSECLCDWERECGSGWWDARVSVCVGSGLGVDSCECVATGIAVMMRRSVTVSTIVSVSFSVLVLIFVPTFVCVSFSVFVSIFVMTRVTVSGALCECEGLGTDVMLYVGLGSPECEGLSECEGRWRLEWMAETVVVDVGRPETVMKESERDADAEWCGMDCDAWVEPECDS